MAKKAFNGACMAGLAPRGTPDFFGPHTTPGRWSIDAAEQPRGLRLPGNQPQSEINVLLWIGAVSYTSPASRRAAAADRGRRAKPPPADGRQSLWLRTTSLAWFSAFSGSRDSRHAARRCCPAAGNSLCGRPGRSGRQTPACGPAFPESAGFRIPCGRSLRGRAPSRTRRIRQ